jgi:hypothetical protein
MRKYLCKSKTVGMVTYKLQVIFDYIDVVGGS